jgi:biotin carboxyl carrier protein
VAETVHADMSASVWKVLVAPGDPVDEESPLLILESMKMEIPVLAESPGVVVAVRVNEGDVVSPGQPLLDLSAD